MGLGQSSEKVNIVAGLFVCDPNSNRAYTPDDEVYADAWYGVGLRGFVFPELRSTDDGVAALKGKDDLAICLSGGGFRAGIASCGYVRGLYMLGVLERARYMNANSGSAWFAGPFSYQQTVSVEDFLGEYVQPEELTLDRAKQVPHGSFAQIVSDGCYLVGNMIRKLAQTNLLCAPFRESSHKNKYRLWEDALGDMLLTPVDENQADSTFCLSGREANAAEAGVPHIHTACDDPSMPYPIITACVIASDRLPAASPFVSYEYTPLYSGVPARIEDAGCKLGGVLVESFAACSHPPTEVIDTRNGRHRVELDLCWTPPLSQAMGNSSQFLAMALSAENPYLWNAMGCPMTRLWNGIDHGSSEFQMTDGGGSDNLAIYPALRRGVKKLFILSALAVPVSPTWASDEYDISGYFGAYPDNESFSYANLPVTNDIWNKASQVFERRKWDELFGKLTGLINQGKPLVIRMKLNVLPNREQGIVGGYEVDTLWMFNGMPHGWWQELPDETKDYIGANIKGFPIVDTFIVDYDPETASVLSNLCTWHILQARKEIAAFLA